MSRRSALVLVVLAVLLAALGLVGCGGDDDAGAESDSTDAPPASSAEPPEGRGTVTVNDDGSRTVRSAFGTATVPAEPKRIVCVIGDIDLEAMLALGVKPVGCGTQGGTVESGFAPHLAGLTDGVTPLPWLDGAAAETIAELQPDLIFTPDVDSVAALSELAPTVPSGSWLGPEWKDDFRYIAAVLGLEDEAEARLADYDARVADLRERLAPIVEGKTAASPQVSHDHANVFVDPADSFSWTVLAELGFAIAPIADEETGGDLIAVSFEWLDELDADFLFWQVRQADDGSPDTDGLETARDNPLWPSIPAVASERLYEVDNRPWYFPTILGAERILDDVERSLL